MRLERHPLQPYVRWPLQPYVCRPLQLHGCQVAWVAWAAWLQGCTVARLHGCVVAWLQGRAVAAGGIDAALKAMEARPSELPLQACNLRPVTCYL